MNKCFITSDTHSYIKDRFEFFADTTGKNLDKDDYVIICGDAGFIWYPTEPNPYMSEEQMKRWLTEENAALDWLDACPWTTLFVSGNHENFDRLYQLPRKEWHGGMVRIVRDSVLLLERGNIFDICGKQFFAFGGASSHDIRDGVLEIGDSRIEEWARDPYKLFRINHVSWWRRELPTSEEMMLGMDNLEKKGYKVDYIISHTMPTQFIKRLGFKDSDRLTEMFDTIYQDVEFEHWYCGHYHVERNMAPTLTICYEKIVQIM